MKYIIVTGGVVSGLGKGITISSIGRILKSSNVRVTAIKIDPYLNVDAGTMSPFEHGETFVLDDGGETDLDLGNYERFLDITLTGRHNITSGKIYKEVIRRERRGDYLGKTVQMVPHATDMVQSWIKEVSKLSVDGTGMCPDVCLIEVGGTVGDIESMVFLEALRQFQFAVGRENTLFVHVSLLPVVGGAGGEQKTKPTQHSVKELRSLGLSPDIIVCRSTNLIDAGTKAKISTFCHVAPSCILSVHDVSNIYHVPLILVEQNMHGLIRQKLQLSTMALQPDLEQWAKMAKIVDSPTNGTVCIAIVGKYTVADQGGDAYLSVTKAIKHASIHMKMEVEIRWVDASLLEGDAHIKTQTDHDAAWATLRTVDAILIPGGFGVRGVEGKIAAARYARENKVPYLGICLGLQVMVIEYCRHVLGQHKAHSTEFDESTPDKVVVFMPEISQTEMGGTMRLGARPTVVSTTLAPSSSSSSSSSTLPSGNISLDYSPRDRRSTPGQVQSSAPTPVSSSSTLSLSLTAPSSSSSASVPSLAAEVYGLVPPSSSSSTSSTASTTTTTTDNSNGNSESNGSSNGSASESENALPFEATFTTLSPEYRPGFASSHSVMERHRHRYEVNPDCVAAIEEKGLFFTGRDDTGSRMEIAELPRDTHPFYFGVQFHPEFKSRPNRPSPPFYAFIAMAQAHKQAREATLQAKTGTAGKERDPYSAANISGAGLLWQSHLAAVKREIAHIYSPTSGRKRPRLPGDV